MVVESRSVIRNAKRARGLPPFPSRARLIFALLVLIRSHCTIWEPGTGYQTAWYKQSNWIRWNSRAAAEGNRWPDLTVPDHVIQQILAARHFSGRLETREYCTHFQERKERLCGELPPYFHWQDRIGHYIGGKREYLILANFTTGSVHTYRNASNRLQL